MGCRTLPEQLIGREFAVEDMALGQADDGLEVRRDERLDIDDLSGKPGAISSSTSSAAFVRLRFSSAQVALSRSV